MKTRHVQKKKINIVFVISFVFHAISLVAIVVMFNNIQLLNKEVDFLNKQSLQFNGRTNNLEGCWKNQDYECPENKYFDASQFTKDEQ